MSALIVDVKLAGNSTPSRLTEANPGNEKVTEYTPGRKSTILYWPAPSVTTLRVFSIRTSLAASTVTPGKTAPDVSFTTPAIALCACATVGTSTSHASAATTRALNLRVIQASFVATPALSRTREKCERVIYRFATVSRRT